MPESLEIERKLQTFATVEDIVSAMKAYSGATIKRTEEMVRAGRAYAEHVRFGLGLLAARDPGRFAPPASGSRGVFVAFGSSQGLCGPLNEHLADALRLALPAGDELLVVGRRLAEAAAERGLTVPAVLSPPVSVSGVRPALARTVSWILERYRSCACYGLTLLYTAVQGPVTRIETKRILPPDLATESAPRPRKEPILHLATGELYEGLLRELIAISISQAFAESLRSENWLRMRILEGATENLNRHLAELRSLRNYLRQEEITEEMLEILASGGFYAR